MAAKNTPKSATNKKKRATRPPTAAKQRAFLSAYSQCGVLTEAAREAKIDPRRVYDWRDRDEDFRKKLVDAKDDAVDMLETEARRRAVDGVEKPVYQGGKKVGTIRKYSDTLLIFLLKGARPETYRDNVSVQHGIDNDPEKRPTLESIMMSMAALTLGARPSNGNGHHGSNGNGNGNGHH